MFSALEADMREKIIELEEENKQLKTEIEKIKLDYIGRAVKLHKTLKRSADLAHKKEFQCFNCWRLNYWDKRCKELESNIETLKSENELFQDRAFYWQARFESKEQDNNCFKKDGKPCKAYERLRKKLIFDRDKNVLSKNYGGLSTVSWTSPFLSVGSLTTSRMPEPSACRMV